MLRNSISVFFFCILNISLFAQTIRTVGASGNYTTIASAFSAINNGTLTGAIELQIISTITETSEAKLNASGMGSASYTSVVIYPIVANLTIQNLSTGNSGPLTLIEFNGADNVTIDGRVNRTGTAKSLTIENRRQLALGGSNNVHNRINTILFNNSATNNRIDYCILKGASNANNATSVNVTWCRRKSASDDYTIEYWSNSSYPWNNATKLEVGNTLSYWGTAPANSALAANTYITEIISPTEFKINTPLPSGWTTGTGVGAQHYLTASNLSGGGIVNFGNSLPSGDGNDNNTITNCDFTNSQGIAARSSITSKGCQLYDFSTSSQKKLSNDNIEISDCNFYDFFLANSSYQGSTQSYSRGISLDQYTSNFTITRNNFYLPNSLNITYRTLSGSGGYSCIYASIATGNGYVTITDNYIGGTSSQCGGTNMTFTSSSSGNATTSTYQVTLINLATLGSTSSVNSTTSVVDRNTIKKIALDYTLWATSSPVYFSAIDVGQGKCHIRDNVIGSDSENSSILLSNRTTTGSYFGIGIRSASCPFGGGDTNISGNKIGGIKTQNSTTPTTSRGFAPIQLTGSCSVSQNIYIKNNVIGSETIANSIETTTTGSNDLTGISVGIPTANYFIDSNKIMNLTNSSTTTGARSVQGIHFGGIAISQTSNYTVRYNQIKNFKTSSTTPTLTMVGINIDRLLPGVSPTVATTNTISHNIIQNFTSTNTTSAANSIQGIYVSLFTNNAVPATPTPNQTTTISNNFISDLYLNASNTNTGASISGICYEVGSGSTIDRSSTVTSSFTNNIISLGNGVSNDCLIFGIRERGTGGATNSFYHNTINIGGSSPSSSSAKTYAILKDMTGTPGTTASHNGTRNIRNNIFNNTRSISGGASNTIHYSLQLISNATTIDYNNHYVSSTGSGNFRAVLGSTDYTDIASWRTALTTSRENNSLNVDPQFTNAASTSAIDYDKDATLDCPKIDAAPTDYFGASRASTAQMGAIEIQSSLPVELLNIHALCHGTFTEINWFTASEHNSSYFNVERSREGYLWEVVATLEAAGNSNTLIEYSYQDLNPNAGTTYYRIAQVDQDGTKETFDPISVACDEDIDGTFISTYPNPGSGDFIVELTNSKLEGDGILQISDAKGSIILENIIQLHKGKNSVFISNHQLKSGFYYVIVKDQYNESFTCKHVVN